MSAAFGWRLDEAHGVLISATLWTAAAGDLCTVQGFSSRAEALHFIALYWVLLANAREDEATKLLREFTAHGTRPS